MKSTARPHHIRDFWLYLLWDRRSNLRLRDWPLRDRGADDTIAAFAALEDRGDLSMRPRHPRALRAALRGKAALNLQIREWSRGWADCGGRTWFDEELKPDFPYMPEWVWNAVDQQHWKFMESPRRKESR